MAGCSPTAEAPPVAELGSALREEAAPSAERAALARGPRDVPILQDARQPQLAVNPRRPLRLALATAACQVLHSSNGGATWSAPVALPLRASGNGCDAPTLAFSPDGQRLYAAYVDLQPGAPPDRIGSSVLVVSTSTDEGRSFGPPTLTPITGFTTPGTPGAIVLRPVLGTHPHPDNADAVYVAATQLRFDLNTAHYALLFSRSLARGAAGSFEPAVTVDEIVNSRGQPNPSAYLDGAQVRGGRRGELLLAWFHSTADGAEAGSAFEIRTARSQDRGASFSPMVIASREVGEPPSILGVFGCYVVWDGAAYPSLAIDSLGVAHLAYARDPGGGDGGDIRYLRSTGPAADPHRSFSAPVTISDDRSGLAQGRAQLQVQQLGPLPRLHVIWEDHRLSPAQSSGGECNPAIAYYDVFHSSHLPLLGWSSNQRVSDRSSVGSQERALLSLGSAGLITFAAWNDRPPGLVTGPEDPRSNISGSLIP